MDIDNYEASMSPVLQEEKTYTFISDPEHKENLSGRVKAACLTCRKKKIKCSGERNCRTCRDRGITCEGLSARRKQPKECRRSSLHGSTLETRNERKRKAGDSRQTCAEQEPVWLETANSPESNDSGYSSTKGDGLETLEVAPSLRLRLASEPSTSMSSCKRVKRDQPGLRIDVWRLDSARPRRSPATISSVGDRNSSIDDSADSPISPPASEPQAEWLDLEPGDSSDLLWQDYQLEAVRDLQALEKEIQPFHSPATWQEGPAILDAKGRHTLTFPLCSPLSGTYEDGTIHEPLQTPYEPFANLVPSTGGRFLGSATPPNLFEPSSWWDFGALDFLQTLQGQQQQQRESHQGSSFMPDDGTKDKRLFYRDLWP